MIWTFHRAEGYDLQGIPPTDDRPHGVFATRSPRRPNPDRTLGRGADAQRWSQLHVRGVDMLDGTPILDIKPYLSSVPEEKVRRGWLGEAEERRRNEQ